jgi:hypothetical protein
MFGHDNVDTIVDIIAETITDSEKRVKCIVDLATNSPTLQWSTYVCEKYTIWVTYENQIQ